MPAAHSTSTAGARDHGGRGRPAPLVWLPTALLAAGLLLGLVLWSRWGFAIAFEAIRTYCF